MPTEGVPRPEEDYSTCGATIDTNWLGMRAPALLISPWVSAGKVIHDPSGPTPTSKYEHSSLLSALKTIFDLPAYLTRRDAWAGDMSKELDLTAPRTDCLAVEHSGVINVLGGGPPLRYENGRWSPIGAKTSCH